jgi:alkylated DNA repair protein (DNA oxidative demethylase)
MTLDLFAAEEPVQAIAPGAVLLRAFALADAEAILADVRAITARAPFRRMFTPGGQAMSVAMSNCGSLGWISDRQGYRYVAADPDSGQPWPPLPPRLLRLAGDAAAGAGFPGFVPDACLINRYAPGTRMSLHQDRDEQDFTQPIVSVSLGLPVTFLFGGLARGDKAARLTLSHGDVLVWGGPARLRFHGVLPLMDGQHPATGAYRINLTFRKAA